VAPGGNCGPGRRHVFHRPSLSLRGRHQAGLTKDSGDKRSSTFGAAAWNVETDVDVAGFGAAGFAAFVRPTHLGAKVLSSKRRLKAIMAGTLAWPGRLPQHLVGR